MALDLSALKNAKARLNNVTTKVVQQDGSEIEERRGTDGSFVEIEEEVNVSNKRRKAVERKRRFGYIVDLKPDLQLANACNGVYLSSQDVITDFQLMKSHGITHIVNAGVGITNVFPKNFVYLNVNLLDLPDSNIREHIDVVLEFMRNAVEGNGNILVHCNAGVSRSSTLVIAYIMKFESLDFDSAFNKVRSVRPSIKPNAGFEKQLREYSVELSSQ